MKKLALISVFDKSGIADFAKGLEANGYDIIATGNTFKLLSEKGIFVTEIKDLTGFPEIFSGRVKTLHPRISGGILMRRDNASDIKESEENNISPIEIVCVNLYPFKEVAKNPNAEIDTLIENIDIGGPTMIRAAAKNNKYVSVLTNPLQYPSFLEELKTGQISFETRKKLAIDAFADAIEIIPRTLAENSGLDPIEMIGALNNAYDEGKFNFGISPDNSNIADMKELGVMEPLRVKTQAIQSASEAASILLRIDDVVSAKDLGGAGPGAGGPPGGMGEDY